MGLILFSTVKERLENELVVVNDDVTLLDGRTAEIDLEELDDSELAVKQRKAEKERREGIRETLEQISLYFKVPRRKFLWTKPQVLFFGESALISKFIGYLPQSFQSSRILRLAQGASVAGRTSSSQRRNCS